MYLNKLRLWNFRKYGSKENESALEVEFQKGVNLLVGENDSGKSTIIDAIKIVLLTQSHEYIKITEDDFHINTENLRVDELKIECEFEDFSENEAKNFLEWLEFYKEDHVTKYRLKLTFSAKLKNSRVYTDLRAGADEDGTVLEATARDMLRSIYLRPLRDAEKEMQSGRNSRLSQILSSYSTFKDGDSHKIVDIIRSANSSLERYFSEDEDGNEIITKIVSQLERFSSDDTSLSAKFSIADLRLKSILESLTLSLEKTRPGLGSLNLLFIASELLLLQKSDNGGLKIALIEEIEAHLHSQAQLRLIEFIQEEYDYSAVQFILSTHSPNLASKVNIKNIILCKNSKVYSLAPAHTKLEKGDYLFLQRFLNSTKANMFFAQGLILVEGAAEQLIIPQLAKLIDCPLSKKGVSLVNVDGTAFLRYSKIFVRSNGENFDMHVSCITDCDVKPKNTGGNIAYDLSELQDKISEKEVYFKNEKYAGDLLMGKSYTVDPISKRRLANNGEEDKYYIKDHHEAIVDRETFETAQEWLSKRSFVRQPKGSNATREKYSRKYAFSSTLECGFCKSNLSRRAWHSNSKYKKVIWQCMVNTKKGKTSCEHSKGIPEEIIESAFLESYTMISGKDRELVDNFVKRVESTLGIESVAKKIKKNQSNLDEILKKKKKLLNLMLEEQLDKSLFESSMYELGEEEKILNEKIEGFNLKLEHEHELAKRITSLKRALNSDIKLKSFDRHIFESLIPVFPKPLTRSGL